MWAATTTNEDYVKMEGWKRVMKNLSHRKEVVVGNLARYASKSKSFVMFPKDIDLDGFSQSTSKLPTVLGTITAITGNGNASSLRRITSVYGLC